MIEQPIDVAQTQKRLWITDFCRRNRLAPANPVHWKLAEQAWKARFNEALISLNKKPEKAFALGDTVRYQRSGEMYTIVALPREDHLLEYCAEPFYAYTGYKNNKPVTWYRRRTEIEDGRFNLVPSNFNLPYER